MRNRIPFCFDRQIIVIKQTEVNIDMFSKRPFGYRSIAIFIPFVRGLFTSVNPSYFNGFTTGGPKVT